jgi:hypothetical protein
MNVRVTECLQTGWLKEHILSCFYSCREYPLDNTKKITDRINAVSLERIISPFIIFIGTREISSGINSAGFKITYE